MISDKLSEKDAQDLDQAITMIEKAADEAGVYVMYSSKASVVVMYDKATDDYFIDKSNKLPGISIFLSQLSFKNFANLTETIIEKLPSLEFMIIGMGDGMDNKVAVRTTDVGLMLYIALITKDSHEVDQIKPTQEIKSITRDEITASILQGSEVTEGFELRGDTSFIVTKRKASNMVLGNGKMKPDSVWQEMYEVKDGKIVLVGKRIGSHKPQEIIPDHTVWDGTWQTVKTSK